MGEPRVGDLARQFAVVLTAISQIYGSYTIGREVGEVAQENRSLILPATYAFSIWGVIFLLCLLYAIYQALPAQRESPVFRAAGWWSAAAFLCNTVWNQIFISRQFAPSQIVIFCGFLFAGMAFFRFVQTANPSRLTTVEQWIVAPAFGLLFGWITAANVVGLANVLVSYGFAPTGQGAETGGAALLIFGSTIAFFVIVLTRTGPSPAWIAYGAAVIWALVAVFLEQSGASMLVGAAAIVGIVLVIAALVGPWGHAPRTHLPAAA